MSHKHTGEIPTSRIGQRVHFGPPGDVKKKGGGGTSGTILDEVWTLGAKEASWGRYCFFSQLIKWDYDGKRTIRLGYYRRRKGEKHWEFGSQTTVNSAPKIVRALLTRTLAKKAWYR